MTTNRLMTADRSARTVIEMEWPRHFGEREDGRASGWASRADKLARSIYSQVAFPKLDPSELSLGDLADEFSASFEDLNGYFAQIDEFARQICNVGIQTTSEYPGLEEKVHAAKLESLCALLKERFPRRSPLRLDLIDRTMERTERSRQEGIRQLFKELKGELFKTAEDVAAYLFETLDHLIERELVGLIEWRGEDLCTFSFHTHEAHSEVTEETTTEDRKVERSRRERKVISQKTETTKGRTVHRHVRHDHELIEATRHPLDPDGKVVIPLRVCDFIRSMPPWIRKLCEVVDGKQILERRIAVDVGSEDWEEVKKHEPVIEQVVQLDPAVTLADVWVLTGWGSKEIQEELDRRESEIVRFRAAQDKKRKEIEHERWAKQWWEEQRDKKAAEKREKEAQARRAEIMAMWRRIGKLVFTTSAVTAVLAWPVYKLMVYGFYWWMTMK